MEYVAVMLEPGDRADARLAEELRRHVTETFPESVQKGEDVGEVEPVLIDADVYGWALTVSHEGWLSAAERSRLLRTADRLERSLLAFPADAQPYYERVLRIARLTLAQA